MNKPCKQLTATLTILFCTFLTAHAQSGFGSSNSWFEAAKSGNVDVIDSHLKKGDQNVNEKDDSKERTALHHAAQNGHTSIVKRLINRNARLYIKDKNGRIPLILAVSSGHLPAVKQLIQAANDGARHRSYLNEALILQIRSDTDATNILKVLIKAGADVRLSNYAGKRPPLHIAVRHGKAQMVDVLLKNGADPNAVVAPQFEPPLVAALQHSKTYEKPEQEDQSNGSSGGFGSSGGNSGEGFGSSNNNSGGGFGSSGGNSGGGFGNNNSGFGKNTEENDTEEHSQHVEKHPKYKQIADRLIRAGADVNRSTPDGTVPLSAAAEIGRVRMVKRLLKKGANPFRLIDFESVEKPVKMLPSKNIEEYISFEKYVPEEKRQKIEDLISKRASHILEQLPDRTVHADVKQRISRLLFQADSNNFKRHAWTRLRRMGHRVRAVRSDKMYEHLIESLLKLHLANHVPSEWFQAAKTGQLKRIKTIQTGWDAVNARDDRWRTALHLASRTGRNKVVRHLLESGASPNPRTLNGHTPLNFALQGAHPETVRILRKAGAHINEHTRSPLIHTIIQQMIRTQNDGPFRKLLTSDLKAPNLPFTGETPLTRLVKNDHLYGVEKRTSQSSDKSDSLTRRDRLTRLINAGADPSAEDERGKTALIYAIQNGDMQLCRTLVENGAKLNQVHTLKLKQSRKSSSDLKTRQTTPLFASIKEHQIQMTTYLIDQGADVNQEVGDTVPLFLAAQQNRLQLAKTLVDAGAKRDYTDSHNDSIMMVAARNGSAELVQYFINQGIDLNQRNNEQETALMVAAEAGKTEIVKRLVQAGAELNRTDKHGLTAVYKAIQEQHVTALQILLQNGAKLGTEQHSRNEIYQFVKKFQNIRLRKTIKTFFIREILDQSFASPEPKTHNRIDQLISQLSESTLSKRQQVTDHLISLGTAAIPQLKQHRNAEDPAVRYRVKYILKQIVLNDILHKIY